MNFIPSLPLASWIEDGLNFLTRNYSGITRGIARITEAGIDILNDVLLAIPEWAFIAIFALICWRLSSRRLALGAILGLGLIWNLGLWVATIQTITLVVLATIVAVVIAIPVGIIAALSQRIYRVVIDRKSTRLNSSHVANSYAVFCLKKKIKRMRDRTLNTL